MRWESGKGGGGKSIDCTRARPSNFQQRHSRDQRQLTILSLLSSSTTLSRSLRADMDPDSEADSDYVPPTHDNGS